jgi:hypothetical protein
MVNREEGLSIYHLPLTVFDLLFTNRPFTNFLRAEDMNKTLSCRMRIVMGCCSLGAVMLLMAVGDARAQDYGLPLGPPPPMKFVSRSERTQLSAARDAKARTRATIELAEARLARAEQLTAGQQFEAASTELGVYQGLVEDALSYLDGAEPKKASRDTYKRLELALRTHCARLEAIRRVTPSEYAVHVKAICECARNARSEALNAFYGDTVIRDTSANDEKSSGGASLNEATPGAAKKQ